MKSSFDTVFNFSSFSKIYILKITFESPKFSLLSNDFFSNMDVEQNDGFTGLEIGPAPQHYYLPVASYKELGFSL